ncbi:MAG TPA: hypothetical protein VFL70_03815 [Bacteroidia bacterium]|nr:hypothetical protein [Bacteroidia bacterium]
MKKNYKIKHTSNNNPKKVPASKTDNVFLLFIVGIYFTLLIIGVIKHEMWRDEWQAWLIAIDSHSLRELYENCRYEGHPILWHLLLFIITSFSHNPFYMQLLHIGIATISVFLFNRYSQLPVWQRILFTFGYYSLYEYSIIARSYSLDLMLVLLFCTLYKNKGQNFIWIFFVLSLLANNSLYGLATACCLVAFLLLDYKINKSYWNYEIVSKYKLSISLFIFLLCACFSLIQIKPESDHERNISFLHLFNVDIIKFISSRIYNAYILIPELKIFPTWNEGAYVSNSAKEPFLSLLIFFGAIFILVRKPIVCALYVVGTIGMVYLVGVVGCYSPRYIGHIFIFFVTAIFLSNQFPDEIFSNKILNKWAQIGKSLQSVFIFIVFGCQMIVGIAYYYNDFLKPFSMSKKAAQYIYDKKMESLPIVGTRDYVLSNLAALLGKKIFYPERNAFASFIIWDGNRNLNRPFEAIIHNVDSLLTGVHPKVLLILNYPLTYMNGNSQFLFTNGMLSSTIRLSFLNKFEGGMVKDESYYIYIASKKSSP